MASESVELQIQQVDGRKNEEPAWSVTNSRLVIDLYRDNPVLYDKNHKGFGNKAVMKKVFALTQAKLPQKSISLRISKFLSFAPWCVL